MPHSERANDLHKLHMTRNRVQLALRATCYGTTIVIKQHKSAKNSIS
jgi:hypothetical protein